MKQKKRIILKILLLVFCAILSTQSRASENGFNSKNYLVIAGKDVKNNAEWQKVVSALQKKHNADILYYENVPREVLPQLKKIKPRYVAIVEKPQNIGRDYVFDFNRLAREVDDDIYTDFLWGIITGYTPEAALKMVHNSTEPLVVKSTVSTIKELESGKWFDTFAYVDDHVVGYYGEKKSPDSAVSREKVEEIITSSSEQAGNLSFTFDNPQEEGEDKKVSTVNVVNNPLQGRPDLLRKFYEFYRDYDPDLIVTASHATENNLEMPGSLGNIKAHEGVLYADFPSGKENLVESGKRRVYLPIGNCLIANVDNTPESMAVAWLNSANVAGMIGYVVTTWHGRNGWGALKYWLTTPGRYTLAEATFLNQQDMLYQLNEWLPELGKINYQFENNHQQNLRRFGETLGEKPTLDQFGFFHDRDVLAYYGDPAWNVRLQELPEETDFSVTQTVKGKKSIITITTKPGFDLKRMKGDDFKKEHVLDIPFSYFFPKRLNNPRLANNQPWEVALDENFILVYNADFKPNSKYEIVLDLD